VKFPKYLRALLPSCCRPCVQPLGTIRRPVRGILRHTLEGLYNDGLNMGILDRAPEAPERDSSNAAHPSVWLDKAAGATVPTVPLGNGASAPANFPGSPSPGAHSTNNPWPATPGPAPSCARDESKRPAPSARRLATTTKTAIFPARHHQILLAAPESNLTQANANLR